MPKFYELYQKYKDKNVAMVAINIDKDDRKDWGKFVQSQGWTWYNATPADTEKQFQETFAAYNLPVSYMLNADKKIVMKRLQPDQFDKHLAKMIE
jgi:thiol-disulfide isomerase/thioredoxin